MNEFEIRKTLYKKSRINPRWFVVSYIIITIFFLALIPFADFIDIHITNDVYASIRIAGSILAFIAATACIVYYLESYNKYYLIVALGFFISGSEDITHGILVFIKIYKYNGLTINKFIYFISSTYVAGGSLLAILIITAVLLEHIVPKSRKSINIEAITYSLLTISIGATVTIIAFNLYLPEIVYPSQVIARPMDFIAALLFLIAFLLVSKRFSYYKDIFSGTLLACIIVNIFAQLYMSFSKQLFDMNFGIANTAAVLSYSFPILGILCETFKKNKLAESVIKEKIEAERKIILLNEQLEDTVNKRTQDLQQSLSNLAKAQEQLVQSEKMSSLGVLAAGVAHEINNPVAYIKSNFESIEEYSASIAAIFTEYAQLLAAFRKGDKNIDKIVSQLELLIKQEDLHYIVEDLKTIAKESKEGLLRIIDIVNSLKYFAHAGNTELKEININDEIETTLKLAWNELKYKCNIIKKFNNLPMLKCYPGELNQVFLNLLVNAAQAIQNKGEITIETSADPKFITITFTDTGSGIPPEYMVKLFDPFFTTKEVGKGTGLGLSISLGIVKKHHGNIKATSKLGQGTTFTIELPIGVDYDNQDDIMR